MQLAIKCSGAGLRWKWSEHSSTQTSNTVASGSDRQMASVQILPDVNSPLGDRQSLFNMLGYQMNSAPVYDLMPNGQIAIIQQIGAGSRRELILVTNWFEELRQRMGSN